MSLYSLSVLCHFVVLADCIRSRYFGGQLVITRNILSFFFSQIRIATFIYDYQDDIQERSRNTRLTLGEV